MRRTERHTSFVIAAVTAILAAPSVHPSARSGQDPPAASAQNQAAAPPASGQNPPPASGQDQQEGFRFRSGVELVNVTATVTDKEGAFVPGLRQEDFAVYEDDRPQAVAYFSSERVPVSLGIALDTSGSMTPDKMASARGALTRFFSDLLGPDDEMFLYRFATAPELVRSWTSDRRVLSRALERLTVGGGTALYDAVAEAVPLVEGGRHRKKALLVVSDGNDTNSSTTAGDVHRLVRESEVLIYAIGVDAQSSGLFVGGSSFPLPFPFPGGRRRSPGGGGYSDERVDAAALRRITDDSGGRTEIVRHLRDLDGATARIADELSKQYALGYARSGGKDGRWHAIRVEVRDRKLHVRARRGYVA